MPSPFAKPSSDSARSQRQRLRPAGRAEDRRTQESSRGRHAEKPSDIPPKGWKDILVRTFKDFGRDQIPMVSAGVTFYALLAMFPALAALVALYGLFADVHTLQQQLAAASPFVPKAALGFIGAQLSRLIAAHKSGLSITAAVGLLASIWSANGAIKSLMAGLNIAYEQREGRGFIKGTLISLAFTVGLIVFGVAAVIVLGAGPLVERTLGPTASLLFDAASYALLVVLLAAGLALLYRYGPSRDPAKIRWITWGSAVAVALWLAMSALFSLYAANFAHYDKTYGSFGAVVAFMMWVYLSFMVVMLGAELNGEMEHQTQADTTVGPPEPMGARGAKMADTVGEAEGS